MITDLSSLGLSEDQLRVMRVFYPFAFNKTVQALTRGTRFVHYTTAETAMHIFRTQQVWMRKSSCMNDFMEIEHGFECLQASYKANKSKIQSIFESRIPDFCSKLEERFNGWLPHFRTGTFIACVSEHGGETDDDEDTIGRLSMWRAYGGKSGVAIVMKGAPFLRPSDAFKAYTNPVAYLSAKGFEQEFQSLLAGLEKNSELLMSMEEDEVLANLFEAFRFAILCTKHPGFREEREWRIVYSPIYERSERLVHEVQSIGGTPQSIYKIPLKNVPNEGLFGIEIPELIDRVIIGPTNHPSEIREALVSLLESAGMKDASTRVYVSDIPLR